MKTYYFNPYERVLISKHYAELKADLGCRLAFKQLSADERQSIQSFVSYIKHGRLPAMYRISDEELIKECNIDKIRCYFACAAGKRVCSVNMPYDIFKQMLECIDNAPNLTDLQRKYIQLGMLASDTVTIECDHVSIHITTK